RSSGLSSGVGALAAGSGADRRGAGAAAGTGADTTGVGGATATGGATGTAGRGTATGVDGSARATCWSGSLASSATIGGCSGLFAGGEKRAPKEGGVSACAVAPVEPGTENLPTTSSATIAAAEPASARRP